MVKGRLRVGFGVTLAFALAAATPASQAKFPTVIKPPKMFALDLSVHGSYSYDYEASGISDKRSITFKTDVPIAYRVLMYAQGKPPSFFRKVVGLPHKLSLGLRGEWSIKVTGSNTDDCQAGGGLASNKAPLTAKGDYGHHDYDMVLTFGVLDNNDPFTYTGTHQGSDPCASTVGPFGDWVTGELRDELATFDATLTVPQRDLQKALRGGRPGIDVHLLPNGGLRSKDCGTTADLGISCTQSLDWTGRVVVTKAK
jgi:hypothetical protein